MILQALCALARREGLPTEDYEYKPVAWLIRVTANGQLLSIESTHQPSMAPGAKKPKLRPKQFLIPRQPGRSGTKAPAAFLVDNAKYVFGCVTPDRVETPLSESDGREKSGWFRDGVLACAKETGDDAATAVAQFLEDLANRRQTVSLPAEVKSNDLFAFALGTGDDLVHSRPLVRAYWEKQRQPAEHEGRASTRCLVTGLPIDEVGLFPKVRGVPQGSPGGSGLVSFNRGAFDSYGWEGNENAPISRSAAEAAATALNRLLSFDYPDPTSPEEKLKVRRFNLSKDTVVVYWTASVSGDEFADILSAILNAAAQDADNVTELYRSVWRGRGTEIEDHSAFYALTLSGAQGRAIIRDWVESSVKDTARCLSQYFADLSIVRSVSSRDLGSPAIPLRSLLNSLAPPGAKDSVPPALASDLVHAALRGGPYPVSLLQKALLRARAEVGRRKDTPLERAEAARRADARAALIKAVLIRTRHLEVLPAMDPTNSNPGYLLGRLMAVLERMQQAALGNQINATVVDRYFGGASATPRVVFTRLVRNLRNHARKAKDDERTAGLAVWLEREADEIMNKGFRQGFPPHLDLDQQGLFVVGYHHERHWLGRPKAEREATRSATPIEN